MLRDLWVMRATELSETGDCVLLTNFEGEARAARKILDDGKVFWENSLVNVVELFCDWSSKVE